MCIDIQKLLINTPTIACKSEVTISRETYIKQFFPFNVLYQNVLLRQNYLVDGHWQKVQSFWHIKVLLSDGNGPV